MSPATEQILLQLVSENRADCKAILSELSELRERVTLLERPAAPSGGGALVGGLGGGLTVVGLVELLQRLGVLH